APVARGSAADRKVLNGRGEVAARAEGRREGQAEAPGVASSSEFALRLGMNGRFAFARQNVLRWIFDFDSELLSCNSLL
ncbi:MAG TPA: hypothetical protein VJR23_07895, partial [Candidatus Acidoferrales bacterium]|nr:hypothetical protein [Candidatus Acidoferrales bacterium]